MAMRNTYCILAMAVLLAGCARDPGTPAPASSASTASAAAADCTPPLDKPWTVSSTLPDGEYLDQPKTGDAITVTCEGHRAWPRYFIHFATSSGQKRFEDLSSIAFRHIARRGLLESEGVEKFLAADKHAEYMKEVAQADYSFLLGSGVVRNGEGAETAVTVVGVPYTVKTSEVADEQTTEHVETKFALILVNLGELKLASDQQSTTPADVSADALQGGVIHGKQ